MSSGALLSPARVTKARYSCSRTPRSLQNFIAGRYEGMSSPSFQGPASAVAPSAPSSAARDAKSARAEGGSPSTFEGSVSTSEYALVASRRLLENCVESSASFIWLALNVSLASPSSPTPESCMLLSDDATMRCCASSSPSAPASAIASTAE